ncbi:MAG: hypothetical protein ACJ76D_11210 [Solirubrobacterales bacterium]
MASPASYDGISADGKVAIFSTSEQMVLGDTDPTVDIFERTFDSSLDEYVTRQVSLGPFGGNDTLPATFDGLSSDGSEVFFSTRERLVSTDHDRKVDIYVRNLVENKTLLASLGTGCGPGCGNGLADANFVPNGVPFEGGKVFFATSESLSAADEDEAQDVYVYDPQAKATALVSAADASCLKLKCGNLAIGAQYQGTDVAGDNAFFTTAESLVEEDLDTSSDIYERDLLTGETLLVSGEGNCPASLNCNPTFRAVSPDGSRAFFESNEQLGTDTDDSQDVFAWSGGDPVVASLGAGGTNGDANAIFSGSSADGSAVYFETDDRFALADSDTKQDVYVRAGGMTELVSAGEGGLGHEDIAATFEWASRTGATDTVFFSTRERLTSADIDDAADVYERSGGATTLVSTGPEGGGGEVEASFRGASQDGSNAYFSTTESLVSDDEDGSADIYRRSASGTSLVSGGQDVGGNGPFGAEFRATSDGGEEVFFNTQEQLSLKDDSAGEEDVYSWSAGETQLVSVKNADDLVLSPPPPALEGTNPPSPNPSLTPAVFGQANAGASVKVYASFDCSGEPVATGSAEELATGLTVEVPVPPESTTSYRATAESAGVVSVCSSPISYKQETPLPSGGGEGGNGSGEGSSGGGASGPSELGGTSSGPGAPSAPPAGGGSAGSSGGLRHDGILYVAPLARITFGPAAKTRLSRPVFRFDDAAEQPGTRFFCRIDRKRWTPCSSPMKLKRLAPGKHVFSLKAMNAIGVGSPPVKRAFKVVAL